MMMIPANCQYNDLKVSKPQFTILGEGEVGVAFPAIFIIGLFRILLGDKTHDLWAGVDVDV